MRITEKQIRGVFAGTEYESIAERDARLLADLFKLGKISIDFLRYERDANAEQWDTFMASGGDNGYSGAAFYVVRLRALSLINPEIGDCRTMALI